MNKKPIKLAAAVLAVSMLTSCGMNYDKSKDVLTVGSRGMSVNEYNYTRESLMTNGSTVDLKESVFSRMQVTLEVLEVAEARGMELSDDDQDAVDTTYNAFLDQLGGKEEYKAVLKSYGISDKFIRELLESSAYMTRLQQEKNYVSEVTDEEIVKYFNNNYRRAKHVLFLIDSDATDEEREEIHAKADEIYERAQAGEDFDSLVAEYSEDPGSISNPDGYYFTDGEMVASFQVAVDALEPGEIGMCESTYGIHIIKRYDLEEGSDAYNEALEDNKSSARQGAASESFAEDLHEMASELGIEVSVNEELKEGLED